MQLLDARAGQHRPPDPEVVPTCLVAARRDTNQQLGNAVLVLNLSLYIRGLRKNAAWRTAETKRSTANISAELRIIEVKKNEVNGRHNAIGLGCSFSASS
jgi:hypothetical protein